MALTLNTLQKSNKIKFYYINNSTFKGLFGDFEGQDVLIHGIQTYYPCNPDTLALDTLTEDTLAEDTLTEDTLASDTLAEDGKLLVETIEPSPPIYEFNTETNDTLTRAANDSKDNIVIIITTSSDHDKAYTYLVHCYDIEVDSSGGDEQQITLIRIGDTDTGQPNPYAFPYAINAESYGFIQRWVNLNNTTESDSKMDFKLYVTSALPSGKPIPQRGSLYWIRDSADTDIKEQRLFMSTGNGQYLRIDLPDVIRKGEYKLDDIVLSGPDDNNGKTTLAFYSKYYYDDGTDEFIKRDDSDDKSKSKCLLAEINLTKIAQYHMIVSDRTGEDGTHESESAYIPDDISRVMLTTGLKCDGYGHVLSYTPYKINTRYKWQSVQ